MVHQLCLNCEHSVIGKKNKTKQLVAANKIFAVVSKHPVCMAKFIGSA